MLEEDVLKSLKEHELVANNVEKEFDETRRTLGERVSDLLAALQAPVIMMSQKRQESRDRLRASSDYKVNLKAELEIRHLHEKIDHLLRKQSQRLFEIQQIQLDLMRELAGVLPRGNQPPSTVVPPDSVR